jgi:hypothetical protein
MGKGRLWWPMHGRGLQSTGEAMAVRKREAREGIVIVVLGTINIEINIMVIETVNQMAIFFIHLNSPTYITIQCIVLQ